MFFQREQRGRPGFTASVLIFLTLGGVVCGMTLLFLGMRSVMEVGGSCGSGGPYVYVQSCPSGVPLAMMGGIWGGVVAFLAYLYFSFRYGVPSWIWLAWPALFLSLGWNFLEFGFDSPGGGGLEWGWIVCGVLFAFMGGGPAVALWYPYPERHPAAALAEIRRHLRAATATRSGLARRADPRPSAWLVAPKRGSAPRERPGRARR